MRTERFWRLRRQLSTAWYALTHSTLPNYFLESGSVFIHIPKAAGSSICRAIYGCEVGHRSINDYERLDRDTLELFFKFTVVRNPWERFVSAYYFLCGGGMPSYPLDRMFARKVLTKYQNINEFAIKWLNPTNAMCYHHFAPQTWFLKNRNGVIGVDFIARLETLDRDFQVIANALQIKTELPRINQSVHPGYRKALSAEAMESVAAVYADDFELLGY